MKGLDLMCSTLQVRRLRVQQRLKNLKPNESSFEDNEMPDIPSSIPFLPSVVNYSFLMCSCSHKLVKVGSSVAVLCLYR